MAVHQQAYRRLIVGALACAAMGLLGVAGATPVSAEMAQRHFTSQESVRRPEEYRRTVHRKVSDRRLKVSRDRISTVKKSSFWNKRPYQFATPLVEGDRLYVGSDSGFFYAFAVEKEQRLWKVKVEGPVQSKPAFADNTLYVGDAKAIVYAINADDGKELWRTAVDTEVFATPLVIGSRLYVADMAGRLYALDRATGVEAWHTDPSDRTIGFSVRGSSSPTAFGNLVVLGTASGAIIAYRQSDGSVAWVRQIGARHNQVYDVDSTPLIVNDRLYVSSADGVLVCVDPLSGNVLWSADAGGVDDLLYEEGRLYASGGGVLTALDASNGNIFWEQDFKTPAISMPAAGARYLAVMSTVDKLYLVDADTGDILFERYVGKGTFGEPVIVNSKLYVLANTSRLYAFDIKELPPRKKKKG